MSDAFELNRAEHLRHEQAKLRRQTAEVAGFIAATEEKVASTLEQVAEHRPPHDAERLRAKAKDARKYAAKEREWSKDHDKRDDDDDHADEHYR